MESVHERMSSHTVFTRLHQLQRLCQCFPSRPLLLLRPCPLAKRVNVRARNGTDSIAINANARYFLTASDYFEPPPRDFINIPTKRLLLRRIRPNVGRVDRILCVNIPCCHLIPNTFNVEFRFTSCTVLRLKFCTGSNMNFLLFEFAV